jgi:hypothetical protein
MVEHKQVDQREVEMLWLQPVVEEEDKDKEHHILQLIRLDLVVTVDQES